MFHAVSVESIVLSPRSMDSLTPAASSGGTVVGEKRKRVAWMPKPEPRIFDGAGTEHPRSGEPVLLALRRFENEDLMRTNYTIGCCDCNLRHLFSFEVWKGSQGQFILSLRAYRIKDKGPRRG